MKKYYLLLICMSLPLIISSQTDIQRTIVEEDYVTTSSMSYNSTDLDYLPEEINGSPFENEIFQPGSIYEGNTSKINDLFFRYNAFKDDIEVKKDLKDPDNKIMVLKKLPYVMVKISNNYYVYDETEKGYYKVLFMGNNYKLYKKISKKHFKAKKAANSFARSTLETFEDKVSYYLISKGDVFHKIPSSKGKRIKFFGNKKDDIKTYVNKYKLDISNEKIFIKIVRYFDSFDDAKL